MLLRNAGFVTPYLKQYFNIGRWLVDDVEFFTQTSFPSRPAMTTYLHFATSVVVEAPLPIDGCCRRGVMPIGCERSDLSDEFRDPVFPGRVTSAKFASTKRC